ncbi:MAG TPA: TetR/AcrR family transcriptional regulator [Acidimicrobiales bacterium]|nr:TetR/AcrR family transcriptional regulator [Acidimicrobiales bacterium]
MTAARGLRRDAEANRQRLLEAAGRLMAERGLATPLEDIAAAAGVGIATLYRRFPTRDDLVAALFADRLADYVADLEASFAIDDGWQALVWFLRRSLERQIADRALKELVEHAGLGGPARQVRQRVLPLAERLVERARATGVLRPDVTVADLVLLTQGVAAIGADTAAVDPDAWRRPLTFVLDGLCTARPAPTPPEVAPLSAEQLDRLHGG